MSTAVAHTRVTVAQILAQTLLDSLPDRWAHTVGVARRAHELARTVDPAERETLVIAAWLHDIGYSPALRDTGFHSLDGAHHLRQHGWPERVCGLVAYHSGAVFTARARGLGEALSGFAHEQSPVSDALAYADQTTGPQGQHLPMEQRMADMLARHGADSPQAQVHPARGAYLRTIRDRVEHRMSAATTARQ